jgi:hypothetical protein
MAGRGDELMPWGRLDDSMYDHPKVDELESLANPCIGIWARAISYCNRWLTDGQISEAVLIRKFRANRKQVDALCRVRLLEKAEGGYVVHDFLEFNDSREQVLVKREQARVAGRAGGLAKWKRAASAPPSDPPSGAPTRAPSDPPSTPPSENLAHGAGSLPTPVPSRPVRDSLDVAAAGTEETRPRDGTWFDPAPRPGIERAGDTLARVVGRRAGSGGSDSR